MEIILAMAVASAVIFFGALISMGNERQRKAIDGLREQVVLWAVQDLKIKRESLARDVQVSDPLSWLNKVATRLCGLDLGLQVVEVFEEFQVIICNSEYDNRKVVFTPFGPVEIRGMKRVKKSQITAYSKRNPLLSLPQNVTAYECSVLRNGILFDVELPLAWKGLTNTEAANMDRIWMYMVT